MKTVVQIVLNSLPSNHTRRNHLRGLRSFLGLFGIERATGPGQAFPADLHI
jgi:hypothetical protein